MADAAAAEMEKMKVEDEKKEVVTALAGAFGVAPPIDTGCAARSSPGAIARPLSLPRASSAAAPPPGPGSCPALRPADIRP